MELDAALAAMFAAHQREDPSASLGELAFRTLRETILRGHLRPDQKLTETQLAAAMGVSRTPVRQAIHMLETEGLVTTQRRQITVAGFEIEELEEVYLVRRALEGLATELAAINMTDEELGELGEVVELMEFYLKRGNLTALQQTTREFHQRIYNASRNRMLITMLANLWDYIESAGGAVSGAERLTPDPLKGHRIILRALHDRDPLLARRLAEGHVMTAKDSMLQAVRNASHTPREGKGSD
ncbi:MAG: GntR family transcriptional regulator [Deinococcales bacterium]